MSLDLPPRENLFPDDSDSSDPTHIDIRIQQRNGRKSITTIDGLIDLNLKEILKSMKKEFHCNGNIVHEEFIQLQGDQRQNVMRFLVDNKLADKDNIIVHGA